MCRSGPKNRLRTHTSGSCISSVGFKGGQVIIVAPEYKGLEAPQ